MTPPGEQAPLRWPPKAFIRQAAEPTATVPTMVDCGRSATDDGNEVAADDVDEPHDDVVDTEATILKMIDDTAIPELTWAR